jgi:hypothetical protein
MAASILEIMDTPCKSTNLFEFNSFWLLKWFLIVEFWTSSLVVRVPGYRSRGPVSIPGVSRFSEK